MSPIKSLVFVLLVAVVLLAPFSLFTVYETDRAIILRLGQLQMVEPGKPKVLMPGLHAKIPFVDDIRHFDQRIQILPISSSRVPTSEKKELIIDLFAKWKIEDFAQFYTSTSGNPRRADQLLSEKIIAKLRAEIGRRNLTEVVSAERQKVMQILKEEADKSAQNLGIRVVDVRVVKIDLPEQVRESVFNTMRAERLRVAEEHRANGRSKSEAIRADADATVTVIEATAKRQSQYLRGEGDATAAKIYADSFNQDPEFYSFYRSMEVYQETFKNKDDMLILKPDNAFFKYFHGTQKEVGPQGG